MLTRRITIALLLIAVVVIAGCTSPCTPENPRSNVTTKAPSVQDCINLCRSYGFEWKTQVTGQDPDKGLLHCNCYVC